MEEYSPNLIRKLDAKSISPFDSSFLIEEFLGNSLFEVLFYEIIVKRKHKY